MATKWLTAFATFISECILQTNNHLHRAKPAPACGDACMCVDVDGCIAAGGRLVTGKEKHIPTGPESEIFEKFIPQSVRLDKRGNVQFVEWLQKPNLLQHFVLCGEDRFPGYVDGSVG